MTTLKKKMIWVLMFVFIGIFFGYFIYLSQAKKSPFAFITVEKGDITVKVVAVGNIVSAHTAAVKSPIAGIVTDLFHQEGDLVKKGDALLAIKPQPTPKDYATLTQKVEITLVEEKNKLAEMQRYESLVHAGAISSNDKDYEEARKEYEKSRLEHELAQKILALVEEGKADIQNKVITNIIVSPIDGRVVERLVNIGDPFTAQTEAQAGSVLFTIADMDALIFRGQVSEIDAAKLQTGVTANVKIAAWPKLSIKGKVNQLALQSIQLGTPRDTLINTTSNVNDKKDSPFNVGYKVEIDHLDVPPDVQLRAGYSATAEVIIATAKNVLIVPERVLHFEQDKIYVWCLNQKNMPEKRFVTLGLSDGIHAQILTGVSLGERILETPPDAKNHE